MARLSSESKPASIGIGPLLGIPIIEDDQHADIPREAAVASVLGSSRGWSWRWLQLPCLVVVAGGVALVARANLAPLWSGDSDEPVYVYQGRMLAQGHATLPIRLYADFLHPWLFGRRGDRLFSQYPPGWPAVIAVGHLLGDERVALVLAAAAAVAATWFLGEQVSRGSGFLSALFLLLAPIFVMQSSLYLSYLWTAALLAGAVGCVVAGVRRGRAFPFFFAGVLLGLALLTRPFDAAIVGAVVVVYAVASLMRDRVTLRRAVVWCGLGAVPFLVVTLIYNAHITGNPLRFPLQAAERLDTFGFGRRAMVPDASPIDYTPHLAWTALVINARTIPKWFAGYGVGFLLAVSAVWLHRRQREVWLLVAAVAVFPVAYFFWWATALAAPGASKGLGPHYYIPAFAFLAVLAGWSLQELTRRSRALGAGVLVVVIAGSLLMVPSVLHTAHFTTALQRAKEPPRTVRLLKNAVVIMRAEPSNYTLVGYPFLVGDPQLADPVLYATDRGPDSVRLAALFPTRKLYQLVQRAEPGHDLLHPSLVLEPIHIIRGSTVRLPFDATNTTGAPVVAASLRIDGRTVAHSIIEKHSKTGDIVSFDVVLGGRDSVLPRPADHELVGRIMNAGQFEVTVAFGQTRQDNPQSDEYDRRYLVSTTKHGLAIQAPGLQYHRYTFGHIVWARENVNEHLSEHF